MVTIRIPLGPEALEAMRRPVVGQGGFQSFLRDLQNQLDEGELVLTPDHVSRIVRYVQSYGQGGFQGRLETVLAELQALARAIQPLV